MAGKFDFAGLEQALGSPDTTTEELRGFVEGIGLTGDLQPGEIFPVGTVTPDAIRTRLHVPPNALQDLVKVLTTSDGVRSWQVFPLGIIAPDRFAIEVDVGRRMSGAGGS